MKSAKCYKVALVNSADPRGAKIGGIETYIRDYIFYHPEDMDLLFIGADEIGDMPIGKVADAEFRGRRFKFLALYRLDDAVNKYTGTVTQSETFRFARQLIDKWRTLRRVLRAGDYSVEVRRPEYAPIFFSMGVPVIQMIHVWGGKDKQQSGVLARYGWLRHASELVSAAIVKKFYSVNSDMTTMFKRRYPMFRGKFDTLTTWANTSIFQPTPFVFDGDRIDVIYAGRMDLFKRPDLMFSVIAELQRLTGRVRFHYVGDGDTEQFPEFSAIRDITVRHGVMKSPEIAALMQQCQMGLLTSDFEGMPRFVMELLTSGRPAVCLHLPQLESVLVDGVTGFIVPRGEDQVAEQARRMLETWTLAHEGQLDPIAIRKAVEPFSPQSLLGKIWNDHRRLHEMAA
ncbi:glycosyltransferase [Novosphingobium sp. B-7]|uniref:glycosyltransferase n=1 Tax=Novosphingobium sp. B-7 TaxID=1298855 RepID=UPI0003FEB334|nr:glycosyltransferase [Novosphingobium sp. B-7]